MTPHEFIQKWQGSTLNERQSLACLWIERGLGVVPMVFDELIGGVVDDNELKNSIAKLVMLKRSGAEMDKGLCIR